MQIIRRSGITGFTTSINTASPNNTVNVAQLLASTASADGDIVITPKGTGAILAQVPDGTATGGNKRGTNAVDLQTVRTANTQVASGLYSVIGGGDTNTSSNNQTTVAGGGTNTASGIAATVAGGVSNTSSGGWATVCGGFTNTASAAFSFVGGGNQNVASGEGSLIVGGQHGNTRGIAYKQVFASGRFSATGDCQIGTQVLRRLATNTTPVVLTADNSAPSTTNQIQLQNNQTIKVRCDILARSSTGLTKNIVAEAVLKRGASASTTTISTPIYTTIYQDTGTENWTMVLSADTTNGCGAITFTIDSVSNVRCMAKVETVELTY